MTNVNNPRGADLIGTFNSAKFDLKVNKYVTTATDATPLFVGDVVKTTGVSNADGIPICTKADAGDALRGIVSSIEAVHVDENSVYRKANTERIIFVADAPYIMIEMQVNGTLTASQVGLYANIVNDGGNTITGLSNTQVDLTSVSTVSRQLRIVDLVERVTNSLGQYSKVRCVIHDHELAHGSSGSQENIWKRVGTTISPFTAGDSLSFGTGTAAFGGDVTIAGKLTVDGVIDPIGLILTPQATASAILDGIAASAIPDGTILYSSTSKDFQFREDGVWHTLDKANIFDATVGNIGSESDYNSIEDARAAGKYNLIVIGNFNETKNVNIGANSVNIKIADTCNMGLFQFLMNSSGNLTIEWGKTTYAYTSPGQLVTNAGTGTFRLVNAVTDGTACTAVSSIAVGNVNGRIEVSNCRCFLSNTISSGFINAYNSSSITDVTFIGGGSACTGAIVNLAGGIASNITFEGTVQNLGEIIKFQNAPSILSGVRYNATNRGIIGLYVDANQIDNLNGNLELDLTNTSENQISNCYIADLDLTNVSAGTNKFSNIHITTENITIEGGLNQFSNFESDANIAINGDGNWFSHARAVNVVVNGDANEAIISSFTGYSDNGNNNSYISHISKDGTLAANTDLALVTMKAIKTYVNLGDVFTRSGDFITPAQANATLKIDNIVEETSSNGVVIEGSLFKDNKLFPNSSSLTRWIQTAGSNGIGIYANGVLSLRVDDGFIIDDPGSSGHSTHTIRRDDSALHNALLKFDNQTDDHVIQFGCYANKASLIFNSTGTTPTAKGDLLEIDYQTGLADFYGTIQTDTINEHTGAAGVTIEGTLLKDGNITIGQAEVGVDYFILWNGETNQAKLSYLEDENRFEFQTTETDTRTNLYVVGEGAGNARLQLEQDASTSFFRLETLATSMQNRVGSAIATMIWNTDNQDCDYVIRGATDNNLLFVDAGTDTVCIGGNTTTSKFNVVGTATISSYINQQGIFASIYVAAASAAQSIPTGATYTKCTAYTTDGENANCTSAAASDKITITQTGRYRVTSSICAKSGTANVIWEGVAFLDGVAKTNLHWKRKLTTTTDVGNMSFDDFIDVTTAPLDVDLRLRHDNGGSVNLTVEYSTLNVEYVGST